MVEMMVGLLVVKMVVLRAGWKAVRMAAKMVVWRVDLLVEQRVVS